MTQLRDLAQPFPANLIKRAPQGKHGDYVPHATINERLLEVLGPFTFELVEVVRGYAAEIKTKNNTFPARENAVVGVVARLTVEVDGRTVSIEEVGSEDNAAMNGDGDNLKTSMSDALKRCAMRLGLGLHLWSRDAYFLDDALADSPNGSDGEFPPEPDFEVTAPIRASDASAITAALAPLKLSRDDARRVVSSVADREVKTLTDLTREEGELLAALTTDQWGETLDLLREPA